MAKNVVLSDIKKLGWDAILLTLKGYRGAVKEYKTITGDKVSIMFYIDECFIVEDSQGLFETEDLKKGLMQLKDIDLESTGCINGLSLIAYINDTNTISYMDNTLTRLGINTEPNREDIKKRLFSVYQLGEMVEVNLGY